MSIQPFDFKGNEVRVILDSNGEPRWVASDIAKILGYRNSSDMTRNLRARNADTQIVRTRSVNGTEQGREMTVINEPGLYQAVLKSRRPEAEEFQDWVTDEVLPSIRKTGSYGAPALSGPELMAAALIEAQSMMQSLEAKNKELEAPAKSWNTMAAAGGDYGVSAAAKTLSRDPNIRIGRDQLFKFMAEIGWIFRTKGKRAHWEAYQDKAITTGRLAHKLSRPFLNEKTGEWEQPAPTIRITPKGLHELHVLLGGTEQIELAA